MSEPPPDAGRVKRRFSARRLLMWGFGGLVALGVLGVGLLALLQARSARELKAVLADLDAADPGWRLEDLEEARLPLADEANSAVLCRELARRLDPSWPTSNIVERYGKIPVGELLDAKRKVFLEDEMARLEPVRLTARRMVGLTRGRHRIDYARKPPGIPFADYDDTKQVAALFDYEALYRANKGEVSEAVRAGRACVCVGRSLYDEVLGPCATRRHEIVAQGMSSIERSLALGESNEAELVALDALLAEEARTDTSVAVIRGERAWTYWVYAKVASGELPADFLSSGERPGLERYLGNEKGYLRRQIPGLLRVYARANENAKLPIHERGVAHQALVAEMYERGDIVRWLTARRMGGGGQSREFAQIGAMRGLIAVERYRMKYKKWPDQLDDVVPEFLKAVPTDPFDGKPIKMVTHLDYPAPDGAPDGTVVRGEGVADGIIVYSVGSDAKDDGSNLRRGESDLPGGDIGYQLWDVAKRRRPASFLQAEETDP